MSTKVVISGSGLYTPAESITNEELVASFNEYVRDYNKKNAAKIGAGELQPLQESSVEFIIKASGIKSRYVMEKAGILDINVMHPRLPQRSNDEHSMQCEISLAAAREAMQQANKTGADIDAVIVACSNLQRAYPAVAVEVQDALGIDGYAYDMNVACSSATFGIQAAADAISQGNARCVLMVNPEITSGHLNFRDRDSHFIFGDVCTAVIVERADSFNAQSAYEILGTRLKTIYSSNIRNNFGYLNRTEPQGLNGEDKLFKQEGRKVFKDVVPMVAELITNHLADVHLAPQEIKRFWLHQANINMNQYITRKVLGREASLDEAPVVLDEYANTSSAGSIIAFHKYNQGLAVNDLGVICSFGAGYSAGNVIVRKIA